MPDNPVTTLHNPTFATKLDHRPAVSPWGINITFSQKGA